jgi:uncharacterized Zn finger protein
VQAAHAGEKSHPQEALIVYAEEAELCIAKRGRPNYRKAAQYLLRMRGIYESMGQIDTWAGLIQGMRSDYERLWSLQEELARAGL